MTDEQFQAHMWLSRMWNVDAEIRALEERAEAILGAKITPYDQDNFGGSDPNPTESKNIEYSTLMAEIERKQNELSRENMKTYNAIQKLSDPMLRGMLFSRYVLRKTWAQVGSEYNYERSQAFEYRKKVLDAIYPHIPKEELSQWIE